MTKVSVLISIARQVDGDRIFVKALRADPSADALYKYLRQNPLPPTEKIGETETVIEYGILEDIDVEIPGK